MRAVWKRLVLGTRIIRTVLTEPLSDRGARLNVLCWAVVTLVITLGLAFALFGRGSVNAFNVGFTAGMAVIDFVMLNWAILGLLNRRGVRQTRAQFDAIVRAGSGLEF